MKTLDKGQDKIKRIADSITLEVLAPARKEADEIIEQAKTTAAAIVKDAEEQALKLVENAKVALEHERNVFTSSLSLAAKQAVESLKQSVEHKLFNDQLVAVVSQQTADPSVIASLITALIQAVEREGLATELSAIIPKSASPQQINALLGDEILRKLQGQSVTVGTFSGGAQVKLADKQLTLDITEETLVEYLRHYVRKDFRNLLFADSQKG